MRVCVPWCVRGCVVVGVCACVCVCACDLGFLRISACVTWGFHTQVCSEVCRQVCVAKCGVTGACASPTSAAASSEADSALARTAACSSQAEPVYTLHR